MRCAVTEVKGQSTGTFVGQNPKWSGSCMICCRFVQLQSDSMLMNSVTLSWTLQSHKQDKTGRHEERGGMLTSPGGVRCPRQMRLERKKASNCNTQTRRILLAQRSRNVQNNSPSLKPCVNHIGQAGSEPSKPSEPVLPDWLLCSAFSASTNSLNPSRFLSF